MKEYEAPIVEIIRLEEADVIVTSGGGGLESEEG